MTRIRIARPLLYAHRDLTRLRIACYVHRDFHNY